MANKIVLKFWEKTFTARFGIGFIGNYLKDEGVSIQDMFKSFQDNPFYVAPKLMYHAIAKGTPEAELTENDIEDLIDDDGGLASPQLALFIEAFGNSLAVEAPQKVGRPKAVAKPKQK